MLDSIMDYSERLQKVLDTVIDGIITIDDRGIIQSFNNSATRIFGYTPQEVIGQNVKMLMPEPYHANHDSYLHNYQTTGQAKIIGIGREVAAKRKNGVVFPAELAVNRMRINDGIMFVGTIRDITDRKQAEEGLLQANAELEEFAYRTSHDLRSPLLSSIGLLKITENAIISDQKDTAIQCISQIRKSLVTLEALVSDILSLTATKNKQEEKQLVDIEKSVDDALEKFAHMEGFTRLGIQTTFTFVDDLWLYTSRITLIIENLISNAIKYQNPEQKLPYIKITTRKSEQNDFIFEVEDNGLGIPQEKRANIFAMFQRFHPKTSFGSGLGLYMIKKSADILGGTVNYQARPEGSLFRLTIPQPNYC